MSGNFEFVIDDGSERGIVGELIAGKIGSASKGNDDMTKFEIFDQALQSTSNGIAFVVFLSQILEIIVKKDNKRTEPSGSAIVLDGTIELLEQGSESFVVL